MRFVLNTALALGVALAGSVAYAQASLEDESQREDAGRMSAPDSPSMANPSDSRNAEPSMEPPCEPEMEQPPAAGRRGATEQDIERQKMMQEEERGAYGPYTTTEEPAEKKSMGYSAELAGGVFNFSDKNTRAVTSLGGSYTARLGFGTKQPIGFEVAYIGTAQDVDALGLASGASLISNGVEGQLRLNLLSGAFKPYLHGGAGWKRYDVVNEDFNTSAVKEQDSVVEFPAGVGMSYTFGKFLVDARGEYRFATDEQLIITETDGPRLDNWNINLGLGVEF